MKRLLISLGVVLSITPVLLQAQTLHVLIFCNTIDESIGQNMLVEYNNVLNQIQSLNSLLDYDLDLVALDGPNCTRARLKAEIEKMDVDPNKDVVFTFYGGHGSHAMNNESDPWPQYLMNSGFENQSNWVPMQTVEKWVAAKNPRLRIIMANCCNKEQSGTTIKPLWADDGRATSLDGLNAENYKKLFSVRGCVMATSSKLGQYSWCNRYGGCYTNDFWAAMTMLGKGTVAADWNSVLKKAYDLCSSRVFSINDYPYKAYQNPYYEVKVENTVVPRGPKPDRTNLSQALAQLTKKEYSEEYRLGLIPGIMRQYFDSGAKVITIANDMQTIVDYEDVSAFLRRICLSDYIKQVNIIEETRNQLTVHEVR